MKYDAVLFDLFGTLVPAFPAVDFRRSLDGMAEALGMEAEAFHRSWAFETWKDRATGVFETVEDNLRAICTSQGVTVTHAQLARAVELRVRFTRSVLRPRPGVLAVLNELRSRRIWLGLVSDSSAEVPAIWAETPLAPFFERPVFSCVLGTKKPDPRMYKAAYEPMAVMPDRCLYVGDGFSRELTGAAQLGMRPILIDVEGESDPAAAECEAGHWTGDRIASLSGVLEIVS
jgi:putative hydrolase of the HAD superfamily